MKYHNRKSPRLKTWDYSTPWWYYITINTRNHRQYFGDIINKQMILNDLGKIADEYWKRRKDAISRTAGQVMASLPVGDVLGKFKAAVTRYAHKNGYFDFSWQARYYDRIIRNEKELYKIRKYILLNPFKWALENDDASNLNI